MAKPRTRTPMAQALAVIVLAGTLLPSCGRSSPTISGPTVSIGTLYPTAGPQGVQGSEEQRGVELAAEWANTHHSIPGQHIQLVSSPADRAEAVPAAMDQLARKGISVVVGSHGSAISAAAAYVATQRHMLVWETGAVGETDPSVAGATNFIRMSPMGATLGQAAIAFIRDQVAPKLNAGRPLRYAVAYVDDAYGRAVGQGAITEIDASNQAMAGSFAYPATGADYPALANRIGAAHPDVLFVSAYIDDGVALRRALIAAHVPLLASIGTSSSYCMPAFGDRLGADAVGLFASDKPDAADVRPDALLPEGRRALAWVTSAYQARYHSAMSAPALSGFANAYALFVHVLPAARSGQAAAVSQAAIAARLPEGTLANGGGMNIAPAGTVDAGANRAPANVIWEWVGPGQRAVVWPPAYAAHPLALLPLAR